MEKEKTKQDETASHHYDISVLSIFIFCFEKSLTLALISSCFCQVIFLIFSKIINLIIHP